MKILDEVRNKNVYIYPIKQLVLTNEKNFNLNRINSLNELKSLYNSLGRFHRKI